MAEHRRLNRALLLGTFLLFFLPIVGAWLMNIFLPDWRPFGTTNHGTLVQPVRALDGAALEVPGGGPADPGLLAERWSVVHLPPGPCDRSCLDVLDRARQVQLALGDDLPRVRLLLLLPEGAPAPARELPEGVTAVVAGADWLEAFAFEDTPGGPAPGVYIVDPQGYLMMRYPADVQQPGLLSDLERLLKISKIG